MSEETKESMEYDLISVSAAHDWLNKSSRNEHSEGVAQVLKDFCEHVRLVDCSSSSSSSTPTQPSSPVAEEPWPVIDIRVLFSVLVRFVVFVVVVTRGKMNFPLSALQDPQFLIPRLVVSVMCIIFFYMHETGFIFRLIVQALQAPMHPPNPNNEAAPANAAQAPPTIGHTLDREIDRLYEAYATLPKEPGILSDLYSLLLSFVCSLFPSWTPRLPNGGHNSDPPPPAEPQPVEERFI